MNQFKICQNKTTAIYVAGRLIGRYLSTKKDRECLLKDGFTEIITGREGKGEKWTEWT